MTMSRNATMHRRSPPPVESFRLCKKSRGTAKSTRQDDFIYLFFLVVTEVGKMKPSVKPATCMQVVEASGEISPG